MIRTTQYKLYLSKTQAKTLSRWMGTCCWIYNRALEQRIKAYKRRGESVDCRHQQEMLTGQRARIDNLRSVPVEFERDALRRVDRGMQAFFRRCKSGNKPGFPRFRFASRYNSLEYLAVGVYLRGDYICIPKLGAIRSRGPLFLPEGIQKTLRIIRRASGWYAQIVLDDAEQIPTIKPTATSVGVDLGLTCFATLSDGSQIDNPRFTKNSQHKLTALQRRVSRRKKGSNNRRKAVLVLRRQHERIADQRKYFCHQHSTDLVQKYDLIAVENLNVSGMVRSRFGKSILDAGWSTFTSQLAVKAAYAGRQVVFVKANNTSQECPDCGRIVAKSLSERVHNCECGLRCHRDHAAARVILSRALVATGATRLRTDLTSDSVILQDQVGRLKQVNKRQ